MGTHAEHKLRPEHLQLLAARLQGHSNCYETLIGLYASTRGLMMDADTMLLETRDGEGFVTFLEVNTQTGRLLHQECRREVQAQNSNGTTQIRSLPAKLDDATLHRQLNRAIEDLLAEPA